MDKDLDSLIKKAFKIRYEETNYPPSQEVWEKVIKRLRKQRKLDRLKRLKHVIAACVLVAVLSGLFIVFNGPVMAFTNKFIKTFVEITDSTIRIHKKIVSIEDKDKEDYFFGRNIEDPRIGEAQKEIHFKLLIPEYIPDSFKLSSVDILNKHEKKEAVTMYYTKTTENGKKDSFQITQRSFPSDSEVTMNIQKEEDTVIEHMDINGVEYTLISYNKDTNALLWDESDKSSEIVGIISKEDIIRVAKSMK